MAADGTRVMVNSPYPYANAPDTSNVVVNGHFETPAQSLWSAKNTEHSSSLSFKAEQQQQQKPSIPHDECDLPPDECWLFKPHKNSIGKGRIIPEISYWLRDIFDSPQSCFFRARRDLLDRLEAILMAGGPIAAYRFGGSVPSLNQVSPGYPDSVRRHPVGYQRRMTFGIPPSGSSDSLSSNIQRPEVYPGSIGQCYFSSVKQPIYSSPPKWSDTQRLSVAPSNSASYLSQSVGSGLRNNVMLGATSKTNSCEELERVTVQGDVQELARMQEDSLKADVAALVAAAAGRHGSQHSLGSLGRRTPDGGHSRVPSVHNSPYSSTQYLSNIGPIQTPYHGEYNQFRPNAIQREPHMASPRHHVATTMEPQPHPVYSITSGQSSRQTVLSSAFPYNAQPDALERSALPVYQQQCVPFSFESRNQFGFRRKASAPSSARLPTLSPHPPVPARRAAKNVLSNSNG